MKDTELKVESTTHTINKESNLTCQRINTFCNFLNSCRDKTNNKEEKVLFNKIIEELNSKRYGLVFEEHREDVDVMLETHIPILEEVKERNLALSNSSNYNFLIEGDNLHSLMLLEEVYRNRIDIIYIDPPYNTGEDNSFIYNDKKINNTDSFMHSKWLSFMNRRLLIARELLSNDGVIFISIDEHEHATLKLLCDKIFDSVNYIGDIIRKTRSRVNNISNGFNIQHEYLLVYAKCKEKVKFYGELKNCDSYVNRDNDINGPWKSSDPTAKGNNDNSKFEIINPYTNQVDVPPVGRVWAFSKSNFEQYVKSGKISFKKEVKKGQRGFIYKTYLSQLKTTYMGVDSLGFTENRYMNSVGTKQINDLNLSFEFPKPIEFIKGVLKSVKKDSLVLDFFAGSGTTGQAVLELNKEDGGNRKFVLCTNNEENICEDITYQRLRTVITGKRLDGTKYSDGLISNLKYFRCVMIDKEQYKVEDCDRDLREDLCFYMQPLLELQNLTAYEDSNNLLLLSEEDIERALNLSYKDLSKYTKLYRYQKLELESSLYSKLIERFRNLGLSFNIINIPDVYYKNKKWALSDELSH